MFKLYHNFFSLIDVYPNIFLDHVSTRSAIARNKIATSRSCPGSCKIKLSKTALKDMQTVFYFFLEHIGRAFALCHNPQALITASGAILAQSRVYITSFETLAGEEFLSATTKI
jgi:hypothetical protein